ncbi:MAG: hypothetical protein KGL39_38120 [Patescibacteria group bacterium]|nr:hypothetical protein [Patescibacteria group bacterium]
MSDEPTPALSAVPAYAIRVQGYRMVTPEGAAVLDILEGPRNEAAKDEGRRAHALSMAMITYGMHTGSPPPMKTVPTAEIVDRASHFYDFLRGADRALGPRLVVK